ncbi:MAG TPA: hypothetical protein IAC30_07495 [Candidatus Faecousia intestinavium]|nr:hypothetical protein [Candidatus Faecousia intestinavium]
MAENAYLSTSWCFASLFIAFSICSAALFWVGVKFTQQSKTDFKSGVNSTISPSAKNWDSVMPKPLQITSNVAIESVVGGKMAITFSKEYFRHSKKGPSPGTKPGDGSFLLVKMENILLNLN